MTLFEKIDGIGSSIKAKELAVILGITYMGARLKLKRKSWTLEDGDKLFKYAGIRVMFVKS